MKKLPPIKTLITDAWEMLNPSLLQLVKLYVICILFFVGIFAVFGSVSFAGGLFGAFQMLSSGGQAIDVLRSVNWPLVGGGVFVVVVLLWVLGLAMGIAMVEIINKKGTLSPIPALKDSLGRIIPLFVYSLLSSFLVIGSMALFVLPGFFVIILMLFAQFEIILNKTSPVNAIKRSVQLVMNNFGQLVVHWGALILLYIVIQVIIPNTLNNIVPQLRGLIGLLSSISGLLMGWFLVAYQIMLFKKLSTKELKTKSIWWLWGMAGIGWVVCILLTSSIVKIVSSPAFMNAITKQRPGMNNERMMRQYQQQYKQQMQQNQNTKDTNTYSY